MNISADTTEEEDDIFQHLFEPVECVQDYRPGGLHPVYLGQTLGDGRYEVLRKLGYGGYSTVWLAQYAGPGSYVALKVLRADKDCAKEIRCYETLRAKAGHHPGVAYIMMLKDHFKIQGPNGSHDCLAYEIMGPNVSSVLDDSRGWNTTAYLTLPCARNSIYQVILGLDSMHDIGLIHGDVYAANVLFALKDLSQESTDVICQPHGQITRGVQRIDGSLQSGDPRHLTLDRPLNHFVSPDGEVKISDLGNAFVETDPPDNLETPPETRSPEMIFDKRISMAQDSWALGCLIYYLLTARSLFELGFMFTEESRNDAHLLQLSSLLGPLPTRLKQSWPRYGSYFGSQGKVKKFTVDCGLSLSSGDSNQSDDDSSSSSSSDGSQAGDEDTQTEPRRRLDIPEPVLAKAQERFNPDAYPKLVKRYERKSYDRGQVPAETIAEYTARNPPLRERWLDEKHPDMDLEEAEVVFDLLQGLLTYDPDQRLSTKQILQHPWIRDYCDPDARQRSREATRKGPQERPLKRKRVEEDEKNKEEERR